MLGRHEPAVELEEGRHGAIRFETGVRWRRRKATQRIRMRTWSKRSQAELGNTGTCRSEPSDWCRPRGAEQISCRVGATEADYAHIPRWMSPNETWGAVIRYCIPKRPLPVLLGAGLLLDSALQM